MNNQVTPEYLTLSNLEIYAGVGKKTLKKWINRGMPVYKVGRLVRVKKGEFDVWMRQFRSGTSEDLDAILDQVLREV
jgi:excisionase family DNA binding protein